MNFFLFSDGFTVIIRRKVKTQQAFCRRDPKGRNQCGLNISVNSFQNTLLIKAITWKLSLCDIRNKANCYSSAYFFFHIFIVT